MNEVLFKIILTLIPVIGIIITGFIVPFIKSKIDTEKLNKIAKWTEYAVKSAEMIYKESGQGTYKKEYVIKFLTNMFNKKKVVITNEQMDVLVESTVQELNKLKTLLN